jgi:hypothetical protein
MWSRRLIIGISRLENDFIAVDLVARLDHPATRVVAP